MKEAGELPKVSNPLAGTRYAACGVSTANEEARRVRQADRLRAARLMSCASVIVEKMMDQRARYAEQEGPPGSGAE